MVIVFFHGWNFIALAQFAGSKCYLLNLKLKETGLQIENKEWEMGGGIGFQFRCLQMACFLCQDLGMVEVLLQHHRRRHHCLELLLIQTRIDEFSM